VNPLAHWYERRLLPYLLDFACGLEPITQRRREVLPQAHGRVLELGMGTGLNLRHYDRGRVQALVGIDPATQMHRLAQRRAARAGLQVQLQALAAERLPFADQSFDCVVCTYTLCSVQDPAAVLAEARRVLRPGGRFLFAEHGLAPDAAVARWQRAIEPAWSRLAGGCRLTRDVPQLLAAAGLQPQMQAAYVARPHTLAYNLWGHATVA
jgi:ubiquinone/menaquinone biosynthesis C-methylase UbiE